MEREMRCNLKDKVIVHLKLRSGQGRNRGVTLDQGDSWTSHVTRHVIPREPVSEERTGDKEVETFS